jgi:phosphate transport system substrate-binding protein
MAAIALTVVVGRPAIGALHVRVCSTPTTDRVVRVIVDSFTSRHESWPYLYDVTAPGDLACDVRFRTVSAGNDDAVIARDGMVAIVNPGNPVWRITTDQLRDVLSGRITDWSQLGGPAGPLVVAVPNDRPDAASVVDDRVMRGAHASDRLVRTLGADAIVRVISSPTGRRSIGIVPFSSAVPARALTVDTVAPSAISIADERYPLTYRVLVDSDFRHPRRAAAALIGFAHSADARPVIARTALVSTADRTPQRAAAASNPGS